MSEKVCFHAESRNFHSEYRYSCRAKQLTPIRSVYKFEFCPADASKSDDAALGFENINTQRTARSSESRAESLLQPNRARNARILCLLPLASRWILIHARRTSIFKKMLNGSLASTCNRLWLLVRTSLRFEMVKLEILSTRASLLCNL